MPSVTVNGSEGGYVVVNYDTAAYAALATSLLGAQTGFLVHGSTTIPGGSVVTGIGTASEVTGLGDVSLVDASTETGQLILTGNGTNLTFSADAGSGSIVAGDGTNTFALGSGDWLLVGGSVDPTTVTLGSGNDTIAMGGPTTVTASTGNETVFGATVGGGVVNAGSGDLTYYSTAGGDTINGGSGLITGFGASGSTSTYVLADGITVLVGAADATMSVTGGSGFTEWFGNTDSSVYFTGASDNNLFVAGSGNETLNAAGATGSNVFFAGSGDDSIVGGSGADILFGGSGDSTLTGGGNDNLFDFVNQTSSTASDTITDWNSTDILGLNGFTAADVTQTVVGGNLLISLSDGTSITFTGVTSDISPTFFSG